MRNIINYTNVMVAGRMEPRAMGDQSRFRRTVCFAFKQ